MADPTVLERNRRWRERNPEYMREYGARRRAQEGWKRGRHLWQRYGLTLDDFDAILLLQARVCRLCFTRLLDDKTTVVDHDHATGQVRGLLHARCNTALGYFERGYTINAKDYIG